MKPKRIFLHHSASTFGTVLDINEWHLKRGFNKIGYHFVILNGIICPRQIEPWPFLNGIVQPGRPIDDNDDLEIWEMGAGVRGYNLDSLHICMIGNSKYTDEQLLAAKTLIAYFCNRYDIYPNGGVFGHKEIDEGKPLCPSLDMNFFREFLVDLCSLKRLKEESET